MLTLVLITYYDIEAGHVDVDCRSDTANDDAYNDEDDVNDPRNSSEMILVLECA